MNTETSSCHRKNQESPKKGKYNFVIVIGRQFGSGGRTVGKIVAQKLGIDYYDTELLQKAAEAVGIDPQIFQQHEEKRPSVMKALLQGAYGIADNFHTVPLSSERIYHLQCSVIKELCKKGSCVIVGRNADFIMRDCCSLLSVFLHAPLEKRISRILSRKDAMTPEEARDLALQHDKRRESFYNFYTGEKKWGVADNYDLCLNTSCLENEEVADIIIKFAKYKFGSTDNQ